MDDTNPNCKPTNGSSDFNCYQLLTPLPSPAGANSQLTNINTSNPIPYVINMAEILVSLGIVIAVFFIVWGGITRMLHPGNEAKQREGMEMIKRTIGGLLLLAFSYILITTINPNLLTNNPFSSGAPATTKPTSPSGYYYINETLKGDQGQTNTYFKFSTLTTCTPAQQGLVKTMGTSQFITISDCTKIP